MENANVDVIAIPCVTVHHFYYELIKEMNTPVLNLVVETAKYIKKKFPKKRTIGILATEGTYRGKIFEKVYQNYNLVTIIPEENSQKMLMESIYANDGIKAGFSTGSPKGKNCQSFKRTDGKGS